MCYWAFECLPGAFLFFFFNTLFCYSIEAKPSIYLPAIRQLAESCVSSPFAKGTLVQIPGCCAALL